MNGPIPFRGIVREVSAAAAQQRRLAAAVNAGYARRGYLHGFWRRNTFRKLRHKVHAMHLPQIVTKRPTASFAAPDECRELQ